MLSRVSGQGHHGPITKKQITSSSPVAIPGKKIAPNMNDAASSDNETICLNGGFLLFSECFCVPGWDGPACEEKWKRAVPQCDEKNDQCFYHPNYGVAAVSEQRAESASLHESKTWADHRRKSDRQNEHLKNFGNFDQLLLNYKRSDLGDVLELGCGPFTNSLMILNATGLSVKSVTLVDPLLREYLSTNLNCAYRSGSLGSHKTTLISARAEAFEPPKKYDTVILVNIIEHVQNAFQVYSRVMKALKPGGLCIFHERFWPRYDGLPDKTREFALHPIRLNMNFALRFSSEFELWYEHSQEERWGNYGYYWYGIRRLDMEFHNVLSAVVSALEKHDTQLISGGFVASRLYGNIFSSKAIQQVGDYARYAMGSKKIICEVGFAAGHSAVTFTTACRECKIFSFDDYGRPAAVRYAHDALPKKDSVTLIKGKSQDGIKSFRIAHPEIYCDVISIDGAHHAHYPTIDIQNFRYIANTPNIVLLDDTSASWPAVQKAVDVATRGDYFQTRHAYVSNVIFRGSRKGWTVGQYDLATVVIQTNRRHQIHVLKSVIKAAAEAGVVQKCIILWDDDVVPPDVSSLSSNEGGNLRIQIVQTNERGLNNRWKATLPLNTDAVIQLDDDVYISSNQLRCVFQHWKLDKTSLYGFGARRVATATTYSGRESGNQKSNMVLPRMIFHRAYLGVYNFDVYDHVREYVLSQAAHCDDIAFQAIITKHTQKAVIHLEMNLHEEPRNGLGFQKDRIRLRRECSRFILGALGWQLPELAEPQENACHEI